jgi:predicted RNA binding protein YcfA (HicA-like mRNA interferase family)
MPKLPRISGLAIVKALERLRFTRLRQSGSHVVMGAMEKAASFLCTTKSKWVRWPVCFVKRIYRQMNSLRRCEMLLNPSFL